MKGKRKLPVIIALGLLAFAALLICANYFCVYSFNRYVVVIITNISIGLAAAFFAMYFYERDENAALKAEKEKLKAEKNLIYRHYKPLEDNVEDINKYCHDARNILNLLWDSTQDSKNTEALAIDFVNRGESLCKNKYCENRLVNTAIESEAERAQRSGIKTDISVSVPDDINIDDIDICTCLFNLLDNAIEANKTSRREQRQITLEMSIVGKYLIIKQSNTYYNKIKKGLKTNKTEPNHGLGIQIIDGIAKKYNGYTEYKTENGKFYSAVFLQN